MSDDFESAVSSWTSQLEKGGRDVLEKAHSWELYEQTVATGFYPYFQALDENQGPIARYEGRQILMFGSNNYLGLTTHPKVREAAVQAVRQYGTSMTGSRFLNGTLKLHEELEGRLAEFFGKESALVFATGYQANLGMLTALINRESVAVVDKYAHASVHDGCRLMQGESILFKHNDCIDAERVLSDIPPDRGALLVVDGVYSMEGDLAPLPDLVRLARKYKIRIAVDDAHGLGVMGPGGKGTTHYYGVQDEVDLLVGTFSKSLASIGGFVASDKKTIDFIKHFGRPMIFSASLAPSCTAAALVALEILENEPERADQVRKNSSFLKRGLDEIGYETGQAASAVVPVIIGDSIKTFMLWKELMDLGVYTNPVLYPAVAKGRELLRVSCLATHTRDHLHQALDIFRKVAQNYEIGSR
ncbi:MAG: pyridoxal phosphate-dependent aminotransferase family protein [Deltaproteobacteria bacterium]|nr:pyridoxal phosphate-dependent aminotransferase family protein [Deltaproteobacteria bacterium]MBI4197182.1 pyridoxal phosphate-dependent aminotransferase family protein [Deltaproteobacteria bacterium]